MDLITHTNGIPTTGTLQIGNEQINYGGKTDTTINITARAVNGTTAAAHDSNDPVYLLDGGQATDAMLVKQIRWTRQGGPAAPASLQDMGQPAGHAAPPSAQVTTRIPTTSSRNDYELLTSQEWYPDSTFTLTMGDIQAHHLDTLPGGHRKRRLGPCRR